MRAILVSVDYSDLLAITLPYNRHHFDEVMVVTSPNDDKTKMIADKCGAVVFTTDSFYKNGADFNKWRALEEGLDYFGRFGWLCIMDADVLWPRDTKLCTCPCHSGIGGMMHIRACCKLGCSLIRGKLYTPRRRMWASFTSVWNEEGIPLDSEHWEESVGGIKIPKPDIWNRFPLHPNIQEFAGYTQIFHATDPALGSPPWHDVTWKHAGGADSFFQSKWQPSHKIRPPWEVLHLGPAGENWCGRATEYLDGSVPTESMERRQRVLDYRRGRVSGASRFDREKIR